MSTPASAVELQIERRIAAEPSRVWSVLTDGLSSWWPKDFHTRADTRMVFEPRLFGRLYEDAGEKGGLLWYEVVGFEPPQRLWLRGNLFSGFGGPATTLVSISLGPDGGGTRFTLTDALVGRINAKSEGSLKEGWTLLVGALAKACEAPGT